MEKLMLVLGAVLAAVGLCSSQLRADGNTLHFEYAVIDAGIGGRTAIGDIDGDGYNDVVVHTWASNRGKGTDGSVAWYRYPEWTKSIIKDNDHIFGDGVVIVDLDGDGHNDIVTCRGNDNSAQVLWFKNPGGPATSGWTEHKVATVETDSEVKDIEVHDMDLDGKGDIVVRTKHKFAVYFQDTPTSWVEKKMNNRQREGMAIGDLDGDGDYDVVMNGFWLENPKDPRNDTWKEYVIDETWYTDTTGGWQDYSVMAEVKDINGDGRADVVLSHSEKRGFKVSWYGSDNPRGGQSAWMKHEVGVVDYCHTLCAADMDMDGDVDIVAGTLKRISNPKVFVFVNNGKGKRWTRTVVGSKSVYKAKVGDIDNDGDIDIVSALSWEDAPVQLWRNMTKNRKGN